MKWANPTKVDFHLNEHIELISCISINVARLKGWATIDMLVIGYYEIKFCLYLYLYICKDIKIEMKTWKSTHLINKPIFLSHTELNSL